MIHGEMAFEEGMLKNARAASATAAADEPAVMVGELSLPGNGFHVPVPAPLREKLAGYVGRHIVLGMRPEHFHLQPTGGESDCCPLNATLNVIEPLGNNMDVYVHTALTDQVVARLEAHADLANESAVTLYVDLRRIHFFEPGETGANLSLSPRPSAVG